MTGITDSSAVVTWTAAGDAPENIQQYYKYELKYKLWGEASASWAVFTTVDHQPDSAGRQQYDLTDLQYDTQHEVKIILVRTVRGNTDELQETDDTMFTTKCTGTVLPQEYLLSNACNMCLTHSCFSY